MGREVRQVHKNFNWPLGKTWGGFLLPSTECPLCAKVGASEKCPLCYGDNSVRPKIDPPWGDHWQLWETVSEGSPITPPCPSKEALAEWLFTNGDPVHGKLTLAHWRRMVDAGWCPSFVIANNRMVSGPESVSL